MKKFNSEEWISRLKTEFYDDESLLSKNYLDLINNEKILENDLKSNYYYGFSKLMPAFFNLCIDTYLCLANRKIENLPYKNILFNIIHIPTFWRLRASYMIFWKGYFVSASELLRAVIENLFTLIAVENKLVLEQDAVMYYSDLKENEKINHKEIEKRIRKRDNMIREAFFGKDSKLSTEAKVVIKDEIIKSLHNCVHKSSNEIALYTRDWFKGIPFPIFPRYHQDLSRLYSNIAFLFGWIFLKILPLLKLEENEFSEEWKKKYKILDGLFEDAVDSLPLRAGRAIEEFVSVYL